MKFLFTQRWAKQESWFFLPWSLKSSWGNRHWSNNPPSCKMFTSNLSAEKESGSKVERIAEEGLRYLWVQNFAYLLFEVGYSLLISCFSLTAVIHFLCAPRVKCRETISTFLRCILREIHWLPLFEKKKYYYYFCNCLPCNYYLILSEK